MPTPNGGYRKALIYQTYTQYMSTGKQVLFVFAKLGTLNTLLIQYNTLSKN